MAVDQYGQQDGQDANPFAQARPPAAQPRRPPPPGRPTLNPNPADPTGPLSPTAPPAPPAPPPGPDTSQYNTDGYSVPGYIAKNFGQVVAGWDQTKWNDANHQTPKYAIGRILAEAGAPSIASIQKAMPNIIAAYPGAQFNGKDKISLDGGKTWVDVLANSGSGVNMQWWWGAEDPNAAAPAAPAPAAPAAPAPTAPAVPDASSTYSSRPPDQSVDPFAASGGGVRLANGQWVPANHPLASGARWEGTSTTSAPGPDPNTAPVYKPYEVAGNGNPVFNAQEDLIKKILANPETMSAQNVAMLQEQQKETALSAQSQLSEQLAQNAVGRGMGLGSGMLASQNRRMGEATQAGLLGSYRDIALQKMERDRVDQIGALDAADSFLGGKSERDLANWQPSYDVWNAQQGYIRDDRRLGQADRGLDQDDTRIGNQSAQFNLSQALAERKFQDDMANWRARLGFDYKAKALDSTDRTAP